MGEIISKISTYYNKAKNGIAKDYNMEIMQNYLEYWDLLETWTHKDLVTAWEAIHNSDLQEELYEQESVLLAFLIDTELQEKLNLYFEDIRNDKERGQIYDY